MWKKNSENEEGKKEEEGKNNNNIDNENNDHEHHRRYHHHHHKCVKRPILEWAPSSTRRGICCNLFLQSDMTSLLERWHVQYKDATVLSEISTTPQSLVVDRHESSRYYRSPEGTGEVALFLSWRISVARNIR